MTGFRSSVFDSTIRRLARRWAGAGTLLPAFPLLARGRPLEIDEISRASGVPTARVDQALEAARCGRDGQGRLVDLYGLMLAPTLHRLTIDGKVLFACCALWAHVIPKLVDTTVRVESVDPSRHELVRLAVTLDGVESADPPGAVATLAVASQEAIDRDVSAAFCWQVRHFVSADSAEEFAAARSSCHVIGIAQLQEAAERLHRSILRAAGA